MFKKKKLTFKLIHWLHQVFIFHKDNTCWYRTNTDDENLNLMQKKSKGCDSSFMKDTTTMVRKENIQVRRRCSVYIPVNAAPSYISKWYLLHSYTCLVCSFSVRKSSRLWMSWKEMTFTIFLFTCPAKEPRRIGGTAAKQQPSAAVPRTDRWPGWRWEFHSTWLVNTKKLRWQTLHLKMINKALGTQASRSRLV